MMRAIASWKDLHLKRLTTVFADLMCAAEPLLSSPNGLELITVPQRKIASASRGFYPMADLATELVKRNLALQYRRDSTSFRREPLDQRSLSNAQRRLNVAGVFRVVPATNLPVVLLDDVWTTGSTMTEVAREISHVRKIKRILVLAKSRD